MRITIDKRHINANFFPYIRDYSTRYLVMYGGAGSGKSHFAAQRMVIKALTSKRKMLFIRKVAATIKDSIYALTLDTLDFLQVRNLCTINKSTFTITLPNGSEIIMKGNDDPEKVKSITGITDIWIEEATELTYDDFLQLDLRLRAPVPDQEIVLTFNPVSKNNWCYLHWFGASPPEDARVLHSTYLDNAFLPEAYVTNLQNLSKYNQAYYKVYALGQFATLDKLIFSSYKTEVPNEHVLGLPKTIGLDFGFTNDPTAAVLIAYDKPNRSVHILEEMYGKGMVTDDIYTELVRKGFDKYNITADSAEPRMIKELGRKGLRISAAKKGKDSILHGLTWLQGNYLVVAPHCNHIINELSNYTWMKDKKTNEYYNVPIDDYNHCIDALRYGTEKYAIGNTIKTMDKALLGL